VSRNIRGQQELQKAKKKFQKRTDQANELEVVNVIMKWTNVYKFSLNENV